MRLCKKCVSTQPIHTQIYSDLFNWFISQLNKYELSKDQMTVIVLHIFLMVTPVHIWHIEKQHVCASVHLAIYVF